MKSKIPKNLDKPIEDIKFFDLKRYGDYQYRSECPKCEGLLLMSRCRKTFMLKELDRCTLCGQAYRYTDINKLRELEGFNGKN
jgi:hypothetical protein